MWYSQLPPCPWFVRSVRTLSRPQNTAKYRNVNMDDTAQLVVLTNEVCQPQWPHGLVGA